ncbi:3-hydroxyacyl-CoA dehydrogenase family protein [Saccharopolyspora rhizosphaerae]|uniref:L-gulonate 3-dehydrogenase n=1 Tax=Saccharopolyspora rhizosphaerae TaxID=2492662 RepID=A0A3R8QSP8_9PSEU|nr:3-hydroxyacyl-CoA dehydrogenase family protein [Saccharopolyspora rhizosphaerae]RRO18684.1 3-hydroxyacyl-CoA dehydrogenase family protein [Saccharopolyspora rhizosphaerae]
MAGAFVRVAVVGAGYMGGGIAQSFAAHGIDCDVADESAQRARERVQRLHEEAGEFAADGLLPPRMADAVREHLRAADSLESAVDGAGYVAEAVPERVDMKSAVLERISANVGRDVVIGTNTSAIPIGELASNVTAPERFLGVHWMNPAPFVPSVEVIPAAGTGSSVVEHVVELLRSVGKVPTVVGDSPGFVANRLQYALFREAARLVEEGVAAPAQVDEVVRNSFGFRLPFFGPFAIADIAGLDVYRDGFTTLEAAYGERIGTPHLLTDQVERGRHGLKSGQGFYEFTDGLGAEVARHRDRAYAELNRLRERLGRVELREQADPPR